MSSINDPGQCCATSGWPSTGTCTCNAFLCYVNQGGGKDCYYTSRGQNGAEIPTTSATGVACCVRGQGICSCYSSSGSCSGFTLVSSCTKSAVPVCSDALTSGDSPVSSCR